MTPVCVLAFAAPPERWGFKRSKKGTSWWIKIAPERVPNCLLALKRLDIGAKALWEDDPKPPPPSPTTHHGKHGQHRLRGKSARADYDRQQRDALDRAYIRKIAPRAEAIAHAAHIEALREARFKADAAKLKAERASQRRIMKAREEAEHVRRVHELYLLSRPVGHA